MTNLRFVYLGLLCAGVCYGARTVVQEIAVTNGGPYGSWTSPEYCPPGQFATGYSMKIEASQFSGDDTAMNSMRLTCSDANGHNINQVTSGQGPFGSWTNLESCPAGKYLVAFVLQVEGPQGSSDDTAANYARFYCRDFVGTQGITEISHSPGQGVWGNYGNYSPTCPVNSAICGLTTKIEGDQGSGDDTTLNDVKFYCCSDLHGK
ncbi:Vitelline membrane outer layer protein 1 [Mactra antiquata]